MGKVLEGACRRPLQIKKARAGMTPARRRRFLEHLAASCNVVASAKAAGMCQGTFYNLRRNDPGFAADWQDALQIGYDRLEDALLARALRGVERTAFTPDAVAIELADVTPDDAKRVAGGQPLEGRVALADVQLALELLKRRHAPDRRGRGGRKPTSVEEVEQALGAKLDSLARRLAGEPGGTGQ